MGKLSSVAERLVCLLILTCFGRGEAVAYSGGEGTRAVPYVLSCREDIMELASRPEDCDRSFLLTDDIDLDGAVFEQPVVSANAVISPSFGEYERLFTGCFNGNGHVIENFSVAGEGGLGFFRAVGQGGRVMHLGLRNVHIDRPEASSVGMLAGVNRGDIVGCYTEGCVTGDSSVGGLVGYQLDGRIVDCFSRGDVEGVSEGVGGLVGILWEGEVRRCYAASTVASGDPSGCGGLVGIRSSWFRGTPRGVVLDSFWDVDVSGLSSSRGGLGLSTEQMYDVSTYLDARWDFAGEEGNGINDIWTQPDEGGYPVLSAFFGVAPAWPAGEGSGDDPYVVSTARELAAMVYCGGGCYFELGADIDLSGIAWSVPIVAEFDGYLDGRGHFVRGFRQDGSCGLFGVVENGSMVTDLHLEGSQVTADEGMVGCLAGENQGRIAGCSAAGIVMGGAVTGGLVGYNKGAVSGCSFLGAVMGYGQAGGIMGGNAGVGINSWSRGAVSGEGNVGGLAGDNSGTIRSCYSVASVVGYGNLGGLVGINGGVVSDCYARGAAAGAHCVGGLVGQNSREVSRCYSTGSVTGSSELGGLIGCDDGATGSALDSFWDVDASGILASAGGRGVSASQMQDIDTFLDAGWDFVGEAINGTNDIWLMGEDGYPELTLSLESTSRSR